MNQRLINEITSLLTKAQIVKNLARKKFFGQFILSLIKSRNVQFCHVAKYLNDTAKVVSNEVRIQDFFRQVTIDYRQVAILILSLLPCEQKLRICIDRTEWDFGKVQFNILMITVGYRELHLPLYWELLDNKSGNSSTNDRIELLKLCLSIIDKARIGYIVADREFIGHKWIKYLKDNKISFLMRLPKHHHITKLDGTVLKVEQIVFQKTKPILLKDVLVDGVLVNAHIQQIAKGDYLYLIGSMKPDFMGQLYAKRWVIETIFQAFKTRGFNLENTHINSVSKLKKLIAFVSIAYGICNSLGMYHHQKVQKIKTKNHGYKAVSFFRKGLNLIQDSLRSSLNTTMVVTMIKLIRWLKYKLHLTQQLKMAG